MAKRGNESSGVTLKSEEVEISEGYELPVQSTPSVGIAFMDNQADVLELASLRRELDRCKLHIQVLLQSNKLLEDKLSQVMREFEEYVNSVRLQICFECGEDMFDQNTDEKVFIDSEKALFTSSTESSPYFNVDPTFNPPPDNLFIKKQQLSDSSPGIQSAFSYGATQGYSLFAAAPLPSPVLPNSVSLASEVKSTSSFTSRSSKVTRSMNPTSNPQVYKPVGILASQQDQLDALPQKERGDLGRLESASSSLVRHESLSSTGRTVPSLQRQDSSMSSVSSASRSSLSTSAVPFTPAMASIIRSSSPAAIASMALKSQNGAFAEPGGVESHPADSSSQSTELCMHFLKGRCRYKRQCKYSHNVTVCPYCNMELPEAKIAASTHLSRCYKSKVKGSSTAGDVEPEQDEDFDSMELNTK
eukprot:TRINITY_DN3683_c0_g1_i1.p1 TRINITY_DN3683_c0_g1~~TRINITY_DN3683_c0_g1_i1.p1  ORF type:complete len:417 (-),score=84.23 TRINITY_DN3683_c0_g1_i1:27-1277(-)